jgi:hypothetical protein
MNERLGGLLIICLLACTLPPASVAQSLVWIDAAFSSPLMGRSAADGSGALTSPLAPASLPEGLARHTGDGRLFLTELAFAGARILRFGADGQGAAPVVSDGSALRGIAVDADSGRLYWSSSNLLNGSALFRSRLDGSGRDTISVFTPGDANLRGVAIDGATRTLFWADVDRGTISRSAMTPGASVTVVLSGLSGPCGIALDTAAQRVYWTESIGGALRRSTYAGTSDTTILSGLGHPSAIALDLQGGHVYWSELNPPRILRAHLDGSMPEVLPITVGVPVALLFVPSGAAAVGREDEVHPLTFSLHPNFPNPFNPETLIGYDLDATSRTTLTVTDILGRTVATLVDEVQQAGRHQAVFRAAGLASGVYLYRLITAGHMSMRKMVLVR